MRDALKTVPLTVPLNQGPASRRAGALFVEDEEKRGGREGYRSCFLLSIFSFPPNHNLRVLEPPGGNVIGDRRLANKPQNDDDISKVLSGWPPWDHTLPGRSPGY